MAQTVVQTADEVKELIIRELSQWIEAHPELRRKLAEVAARGDEKPGGKTIPPGEMTYQEFLQWCDEDTWAEWVDGEVIVLSPASPRHQRIAGFVYKVLSTYAETQAIGEVFQAPFLMRLPEVLRRGREPDLLFVAREHLSRLSEGGLEGPADVAIEIISPESGGRDRGEKYYEYEAAGVSEYWLLDPLRERAEFYRLNEERQYEMAFAGREGAYRSEAIPGFWLRVEWLWQEPLPPTLDVLRELNLIP